MPAVRSIDHDVAAEQVGEQLLEAGDVAAVGKHAAGAIVGSALVEVLERGEDPQPFLQSLRGA